MRGLYPRPSYGEPLRGFATEGEDSPSEPIDYGLLADATPVFVIEHTDATYHERRGGYDQGTWQHTLCLEIPTDRFIIASTHIGTGKEKVIYALSTLDWRRQVPPCQSWKWTGAPAEL